MLNRIDENPYKSPAERGDRTQEPQQGPWRSVVLVLLIAGLLFVVVLLVTLTSLVLPAWLAWRVSVKAGFPGAMGLLVLIPLGILLFLFVLAFRPCKHAPPVT
jgi:hypothetical protein